MREGELRQERSVVELDYRDPFMLHVNLEKQTGIVWNTAAQDNTSAKIAATFFGA